MALAVEKLEERGPALPRSLEDTVESSRHSKRKAYDVLLNLAELREAKELTQSELAERLGVSQPNVSKLEAATASPHAGAIYLSTLSGYIAALGSHLEVWAVFPDHPEDDVAVGGGWVREPDARRRGG